MRSLSLLALVLVFSGCAELEGLLPAAFNGCSNVVSYTFGRSLSGTLTPSDCTLPEDRSKRVDYYELRVTEPINEARIRAGDGDLDPLMILYRRDGTELGRNDDVTPVLNTAARVQRRLEPGTYVIAVTSSGPNQIGSYGLSAVVQQP